MSLTDSQQSIPKVHEQQISVFPSHLNESQLKSTDRSHDNQSHNQLTNNIIINLKSKSGMSSN